MQPARLDAVLEPVAEKDKPGRHPLFPDGGVDGGDQGGTAFRLHLCGTLGEHHHGDVSGRRKLLEATDNVVENLESPGRGGRPLIPVRFSLRRSEHDRGIPLLPLASVAARVSGSLGNAWLTRADSESTTTRDVPCGMQVARGLHSRAIK